MSALTLGVAILLLGAGLFVLGRHEPERRRQRKTRDSLIGDLAAYLRGTSAQIGGRRLSALQTFVYVSDSKVDMLYEQLDDAARRQVTHDLKLDAKFLTYGINASPSPEATRAGRLAAVCAALDDSGAVGTIDEPKLYFRGRINMKTGRQTVLAEERDAVFFMGERADHSLIFLGGTAHHLIGSVGSPTWSQSGITGLLRALAAASHDRQQVDLDQSASSWPHEARDIWRGHRFTPAQPIEFLALRLAQSIGGSTPELDDAILGAPIYVALVDSN